MLSSVNHAKERNGLYLVSLVIVPFVVALATPIVLRTFAKYNNSIGLFDAAIDSIFDLINAVRFGGVRVAAVLFANYLFTYGAATLVCLIFAKKWNRSRVYCVLACAIVASLVFAVPDYIHMWGRSINNIPAELKHRESVDPGGLWLYHTCTAKPQMFIGIAIGWLLGMLPFIKKDKRYWLSRGLCPKCHYILKNGADAGCPECGWNRADGSGDLAAPAEQSRRRRGGKCTIRNR